MDAQLAAVREVTTFFNAHGIKHFVIPVDLGLAFLPYEAQAVDRGMLIRHQGAEFLVCTAEDLIIQKAVSEREKDWSDIEGILMRQLGSLDQDYVVHWLEQFADALERPSLVQRYRELCKRTGLPQ